METCRNIVGEPHFAGVGPSEVAKRFQTISVSKNLSISEMPRVREIDARPCAKSNEQELLALMPRETCLRVPRYEVLFLFPVKKE